ncbi:MAG TPA: muconolactone Delta-isomerase family protein [Thermoanaerobaculia bacterium]|nr:muconolactone Delta-isomerase family protein [Thermoanaerobaculia bacterium]
MKYLVTCHPTQYPMEPARAAGMIQAAVRWIEDRLADGSMETTYLFPNRGGIAIMEAGSHEHLMEMLLGYPAFPLYTWDVQPLCDWRAGFAQVTAMLGRASGG